MTLVSGRIAFFPLFVDSSPTPDTALGVDTLDPHYKVHEVLSKLSSKYVHGFYRVQEI